MASPSTPEPVEGSTENPYVTSLVKNIRAINKKLSAMHKTDAVIEANPSVSLDELVAQRKINNDQRASALKKPQLQAQLAALEEQVQQYKKFDADCQAQLQKQKAELSSAHSAELDKIKQEAQAEALAHGQAELKKKLLVFSQFLRAAAAKRNAEEDEETDENRAFEGTLLMVYGGDQKAVDTAISLIEGTDEQVTSIEGTLLPVKFAQVKQASVDHAPFPTEDTYTESAPAQEAAGSDPTATHAGLTELQQPQTNGAPASTTDNTASTVQAEGNVAAERWDTTTAGAEKGGLEESYEIIPRPNDEVDTPVTAATEAPQQQQTTNWADETVAGNIAGESWDTKAPGQDVAADNISKPNGAADDGFHEVPGRTRGTGRGRGGPRGGRGGPRGNGRGGPFRGGNRRPRGDGAPAPARA